jgi:DNA-binding transcriptional LysR family regulator
LETELGLALFEHSAKAIRLTEAGKIFLLEAWAVLQRAEDAVALTKSVAKQKRGQVHVGYSMPASVEILPRALQAFQRANPQPTDFQGLTVEELGTYPLRVATHKKHRFARLREVPMSEVAKQPILAFSGEEYPSYQAFVANLLLPYTTAPKIMAEYDNLESIVVGVEAGRGGARTVRVLVSSDIVSSPIRHEPVKEKSVLRSSRG